MELGYVSENYDTELTKKQVEALINRGIKQDNIYIDENQNAKTDKPMLNQVKNKLKVGDALVVYSLERLARSTRELLSTLIELAEKEIKIESLIEDVVIERSDTVLLAALLHSHEEMASIRIKEGVIAAREKGQRWGRPQVDNEKISQAVTMYKSGEHTLKEIREKTGISKTSLYRYIKKESE